MYNKINDKTNVDVSNLPYCNIGQESFQVDF